MPTDLTSGDVPDAPWALLGEAVVGIVAGRHRRRMAGERRMPTGVAWAPGPAIVVALRYTESPVGPFLELAVLEPARLGLRLGLCVTTSVVSVPGARVGGRLGWGFPRELGRLTWSADADSRRLRWDDRGIEVRAHVTRKRLPMLLPIRALQRRGDGPVVVPGRFRAVLRGARVEIDIPPDDPLAALAGSHRGVGLDGLRLLLRPARRPAGLLSTLRAPATAPEPALSSVPRRPVGVSTTSDRGAVRRYSASPPRAYSSVG